jgi:hypothetical protein
MNSMSGKELAKLLECNGRVLLRVKGSSTTPSKIFLMSFYLDLILTGSAGVKAQSKTPKPNRKQE